MNPQELENVAQRINEGLMQLMKNFNSSSLQQEVSIVLPKKKKRIDNIHFY